MNIHMYRPGDKVSYNGNRHKELQGDLGVILVRVQNQEDSYVVDFSKESYVMHESLLIPFKSTEKKKNGPDVEKKSRRHNQENSED